MPNSPDPSPFHGFYTPRSTQVPDNFFDQVMPDLSGAETKVLLYIFRRTFGFKKNADNISLSQLVGGITKQNGEVLDRGTGLAKSSVTQALDRLVQKGMVIKTRRNTARKGHEATTYEPVLFGEPPLSENRTRGVRKSDKPLSENKTHNKTGNNKQSDKTVNGRRPSPVRRLPDVEQPDGKAEALALEILQRLGDQQSERFYLLVAAKVPEQVIRTALAEINSDGAEQPPRAFTYRMNRYALNRLKQGIGE